MLARECDPVVRSLQAAIPYFAARLRARLIAALGAPPRTGGRTSAFALDLTYLM